MGAWGTGPFDNDDAADWAGDLGDAPDPLGFAMTTLREALEDEDYFDLTVGNSVIAAAAWLASGIPEGPPVDPDYGPDVSPDEVPVESARAAVAALERVIGPDSEWRELWDEAGETAEALAPVEQILAALRSVY